MDTYKCKLCGHVVDANDQPDKCPVCGAPKEDMEKQ